MAFVKLDCAMLRSSIWNQKAARDIFITALLMAAPYEVREPMPQISIGSLELTGWEVPPGWYGLVEAAGSNIIETAMVDRKLGLDALRELGEPELETKSTKFQGRRLVRVEGGFIVLKFIDYRDKDHTNAERQRRFRERNSKIERAAKEIAKGGTIRPPHVEEAKKNGRMKSRGTKPSARIVEPNEHLKHE